MFKTFVNLEIYTDEKTVIYCMRSISYFIQSRESQNLALLGSMLF